MKLFKLLSLLSFACVLNVSADIWQDIEEGLVKSIPHVGSTFTEPVKDVRPAVTREVTQITPSQARAKASDVTYSRARASARRLT